MVNQTKDGKLTSLTSTCFLRKCIYTPLQTTCCFFQILFLKQVWKDLFRTLFCFLFWLDPWLSMFQVDQQPFAAPILRLAHQNRLENRQPDLLKYLLVGTGKGWTGGKVVIGMRWLGMLPASWFLPGSKPSFEYPWGMVWWRIIFRFHTVWWRTFRVVLEEVFVLRVRTCLITIAIGQWWFFPTPTVPRLTRWASKDETIPWAHGDGGYFHPLPHASCRSCQHCLLGHRGMVFGVLASVSPVRAPKEHHSTPPGNAGWKLIHQVQVHTF